MTQSFLITNSTHPAVETSLVTATTDWTTSVAVLVANGTADVIGRTDTVVGVWFVATVIAGVVMATGDTVGRTVAVRAGVGCAWLMAIGRILAVGVTSGLIVVVTVGVGVGLMVAVGGTALLGAAVVTTAEVSSGGERLD